MALDALLPRAAAAAVAAAVGYVAAAASNVCAFSDGVRTALFAGPFASFVS